MAPATRPVERFFQEMRKALANQVFATIEEVEDAIVLACRGFFQNPNAVQKLTLFPYIKYAFLNQN